MRELDELFRSGFNYITKIFEMDLARSPELQLKKAVLDFAYEHHGPKNLLIVYYTGHGEYDSEKKDYRLHACVASIHDSKGEPLSTNTIILQISRSV